MLTERVLRGLRTAQQRFHTIRPGPYTTASMVLTCMHWLLILSDEWARARGVEHARLVMSSRTHMRG